MATLLSLASGEHYWLSTPEGMVVEALNDAGGTYGQHFVGFATEGGGHIYVNAWQVVSVQEVKRGR